MMKGAQVYARNFSQGPKWVRGILRESNGPIAFEVELENGRMWRRHQDHLIQRAIVILRHGPSHKSRKVFLQS